MTCKPFNSISYWIDCQAETLTKAKREASKAFNGHDSSSQIMVAQDVQTCRVIISQRQVAVKEWTAT